MRILLLCHAFNSLSQRLHVALREDGHEVAVELDVHDQMTEDAVALFAPDLVIAPFLKRRIPESLWRRIPCWVVHPGPMGDRGPSSLDWAIIEGASQWGVTVLEANGEMDAGDIWASESFSMRDASKSSLYRHEVGGAAIRAVRSALARKLAGGRPQPLNYERPDVTGRLRPAIKQADRAINWATDDMQTVLRKIRSADGQPGLKDEIEGQTYYLFDARPAPKLSGPPGAFVARQGRYLARACRDGAVWIGRLRRSGLLELKYPAAELLRDLAADLPQAPLAQNHGIGAEDISYEEDAGVGYLHFAFPNGAMGVAQCQALAEAFTQAASRPIRVLVLLGGPDFWSNGIDLAAIEAAFSPADQSWRSIEAMNDLARSIITCDDRLVISALNGDAGAGGVFLALAGDEVWLRQGVTLNPHYRGMGNLYGSEYWTYLLPRRCGALRAREVTEARLPMGSAEALGLKLADAAFGDDSAGFLAELRERASRLAADIAWDARMAAKRAARAADEAQKPLARYRAEEMERMKRNFYGFDPSYHVARYNFLFQIPKARTPSYLAPHRRPLARAASCAKDQGTL